MMVIEVRFWREQDLPAMRYFAVINAWLILPPDDRQVASIGMVAQLAESNLMRVLQSPGGTAILAVEGERPVGYLLVAIQPDEKTGEYQGYMADIYIEPEYRKLGIAGRLHEMGEGHLQRLGIRRATNWTHAHNPLGQRSAERRGYRPWGMMMVKSLRS
jgi:GNAT superfamily N-acetyltransferase